MPFCPDCQEEYDDSVSTCADCGADLVESLGAGDEAGGTWTVAVENEQVGQLLVDLLLAEGVDVGLAAEKQEINGRELPGVTIPREYAEFLNIFFAHSRRFQVSEVDEQGRPVIDFVKSRATGEVPHPELLRKKPREVREMGAAVIPQLMAIFESGVAEARHWAGRRLLDLGGEALGALRDSMIGAAVVGERDQVFAAVRVLDEAHEGGYEPPRGVPTPVLEGLRAEDAPVRALCALVVGRYGEPANVAGLTGLLGDPEPLVVEEAVEALESLTGIRVDVHAGSSEDEIAAAKREFADRG